MQRKLTQLQLNDLQSKHKIKTQAANHGAGEICHILQNCPSSLLGPNWVEQGRGAYPSQCGGGGPVNPWAGPKYGFRGAQRILLGRVSSR